MGLIHREVERETDNQNYLIIRWDHTQKKLLALNYSQNYMRQSLAIGLKSIHIDL